MYNSRASTVDEGDVRDIGTRFLVFPQPSFIPGYEKPEVVWISARPGEIGAGPSDRRIYVVDPLMTKTPYEFPYLPPYFGPLRSTAAPGPTGHFDHISTESTEFLAAHAYACVRRILDIFETYVGHEIPWFFEPTYTRFEVVPHLAWDNAQSGYGFLEMGEDEYRGQIHPFALNFDAISHEVGHLILFGMLGIPDFKAPSSEFLAYHEAVADFIALIGLLHFDSVTDRVLRKTRGNLLIFNELDRFAELSEETQIRKFNHSLKMQDVGSEVHDLSKPFAGALFDTLIEIFQVLMFKRGFSIIHPSQFANFRRELSDLEIKGLLSVSREEYEHRHFAVKAALVDARDIVANLLVKSWRHLATDSFAFHLAADALITASRRSEYEEYADNIIDVFVWRQILD